MLEQGAFPEIGRAVTDRLIYFRFAGSGEGPRVVDLDRTVIEAAREAENGLGQLLAHYAGADAPFFSKPRVEFINDIDEYDQLARRKEWAEHEDVE
ncbi:MAG: hypothetical protein WDN76_07210 [Alphaproteobacteria bacterium]